MKKITLIVSFLLLFAGFGFAQTPPAAATKTTKTTGTTHLKKDGTADKRFKENKTTTTHLKKDGTPDKRYKENKTPTTPKKSS
jgi:hypothetical protein